MIFHKLQEFRKSVYENLGTAKDGVNQILSVFPANDRELQPS